MYTMTQVSRVQKSRCRGLDRILNLVPVLALVLSSAALAVDNVELQYAIGSAGDWSGNGTEVLGPPDGNCSNMGAVAKLNLANFDFVLAGATAITGISAEIFSATGDAGGQNIGVQLASDATNADTPTLLGTQQMLLVPQVGSNCASAVPVNNGMTGLGDWGLGAWPAVATVQAPTFGLSFEKLEQSSIKVDSICMEVSYTTDAGDAVEEDCFAVAVCDMAAECCLPDGSDFQPSTALCRAGSGDICDPDEFCTGASETCPVDVFASSSTVCNAGSGDLCDPDELCTGVAGDACPTDTIASSTTVCNPGSGDVCDPDELCTGVADATCPTDTIASSTTVCNPGSGDVCDPDELCTGVADAACPTDTIASSTTVCNPGSGDTCDPDELCTGVADAACPADTFATSSTVCRAGGGDACDPAELCPGVADGTCPVDTMSSSSTVCRAGSGDLCDPDEFCTGVEGEDCPTDIVASSTTLCNAGSGDFCDPDEFCSGSAGEACPNDIFASSSTVCNAGSGDLCDPDEFCPGSAGGTCPVDTVAEVGTVCRASVDECDQEETCTGVTDAACPADSGYDFDLCPADPIPTTNNWSAALLVLLLGLAGMVFYRRRKVM